METYTSLSDKNKSIIKKRLDKFKKYIEEKNKNNILLMKNINYYVYIENNI
jgi:hypothetical protein